MESETVSIYGSYETKAALVRAVQLSLLAITKEVEEPSSYQMAELVTDIIIIPLIMEFHE
jgi:hypothetical protein